LWGLEFEVMPKTVNAIAAFKAFLEGQGHKNVASRTTPLTNI